MIEVEADRRLRFVVDLGNSRIKWGQANLDPTGQILQSLATPTDDPAAWTTAIDRLNPQGRDCRWAISTVNPPVADRLSRFLEARNVHADHVQWFRSAAEVPLRNALEHPETAGADRALAALAARQLAPENRPGLVISCGTAITVERIDKGGVWLGGAIAPGLGLFASALHQGTAQLPWVSLAADLAEAPPPPFGPSTAKALTAGIFWGTVGAARELVRQSSANGECWQIWTGGDAAWLALQVDGPTAWIVSDLVLIGLVRAAFGFGTSQEPKLDGS